MGHVDASTVARQFKRTFDEDSLNELGRTTRLCQRLRDVTPYRLMLTLVEAFACGTLDSIADIQRAFVALCERPVQYKPFHNQLRKPGFPVFVRLMLSRLLNELASDALHFSADSAFARFDHIRMQDGTSFALKDALAGTFPGRFTTVSPAAVELHVDMDLMSEMVNRVTLSADTEGERHFLPPPEEVAGGLLLADRGYFGTRYLASLDNAGGHFIVRGKTNMNPLVLKAIGPDGREIKRFRNQPLKAIRARLSRYDHLDLDVRFPTRAGGFACRLVVHPHLREKGMPRYLVTNLERDRFSTEQVSDGYRLRWQVELLFKEWKSHSNLHAFDTANANIAEGLIWASLCAATIKRFCAHSAQRVARKAISTRIVAKCIHHVLPDVLRTMLHRPALTNSTMQRLIEYLSDNAQRPHPARDRKSGRLKTGLVHTYVSG